MDVEIFINEKEFSKPADELIEAIKQRLERAGYKADKKTILKIANKVLESRND